MGISRIEFRAANLSQSNIYIRTDNVGAFFDALYVKQQLLISTYCAPFMYTQVHIIDNVSLNAHPIHDMTVHMASVDVDAY